MKQIRMTAFNWKGKLQMFAKAHPVLASVGYVIAVPLSMLAGISVLTAAVSVPAAMLYGWL